MGPASQQRTHLVQALFNGSGKANRPMSNLLGENKYQLSEKDYSGFVVFATMMPKTWASSQVWAAVWAEAVIPGFPVVSNFLKIKKECAGPIAALKIANNASNLGATAFASVKLSNMGAVIRIPVLHIASSTDTATGATKPSESSTVNLLKSICSTTVANEWLAANPVIPDFSQLKVTSTADLKLDFLSPKDRNIFKKMNASLSVVEAAGGHRLFLDFAVNREQVSYLCTNEFDDVRPIDLYGFVRVWADGRTASVSLPQTTKPLADIVATLPRGGEPRTNSDGVLIDFDSRLLYLPKVFDNVSLYDIKLRDALLNDDGTVCQFTGTGMRTLPPMQNVLIDWVNKKWSYANGSGNLEVRDMSRSRPVTPSHIRSFLASVVETGSSAMTFVSRTSNLASLVGMPAIDSPNKFVLDGVKLLQLNYRHEGTTIEGFCLWHIAELGKMYNKPEYEWQNELPQLAPYSDFCATVKRLVASIKKDEDTYYKEYSVITISEFLAQAILFGKYAEDFAAIDTQDKTDRAKYTAPPLDANYQLPDMPYMSESGAITKGMTKDQIKQARSTARGLMPHQLNVCNMLRDSPDNAIIAVQAGGGKTPIGVVDILKEMKLGVKGPFLVMCPAHLVSQYIQEFAHFTSGRINCIAVTKYTIDTLGFDALQKTIQAAPVNTVVIADYGLANGQMTVNVGYGTSSTEMYQVVEFLRQFRFQYVICDESHKLKNTSATVSRAVATLISDIPKKRLASGTFMDNSPSDIAGQMSLMDPTIFGSEENFNSKYSESGSKSKIVKYRPGAELEILNKLRTNTRYISVKRKEWAAALPPRIESMQHMVSLSTEQRRVYEIILQKSIEELQDAAKTNSKLADLLGIGVKSDPNADQEAIIADLDEEESDNDMVGGLDKLLQPYLARLEAFIVAPASDPLGNVELNGSDRISPKIEELVNIFREHVDVKKIPGKILVFTNQTDSAISLYDNLPDDIKKRTIHFESTNRDACGAEFETNDEKQMMIGVSQGMETGLNLQFCSRLIRCETVMSPGALEQGNARIGRPNIKVEETRPNTFYDWILADGTIDITKVAYLMTKKVRIAVIEEADNPLYVDLTNNIPELFKLSLDNIRTNNTESTLEPYLGNPNGVYRQFLQTEAADFENFRQTHPEILGPDGKLKMTEMKRSDNIDGSAIIRRIPYVPGLHLYGADKLGLVRLDQYLKSSEEEEIRKSLKKGGKPVTDKAVAPTIKNGARDAYIKDFRTRAIGLYVHTDAGEGKIKDMRVSKVAKPEVLVELATGEVVYLNVLAIYVVTKPQTCGEDIRGSLAKMTGDIPIDTPWVAPDIKVTVPSEAVIEKVEKKQKSADSKTLSVALNLVVTNDMVGLEFADPATNKKTAKILIGLKFLPSPHHAYAILKTPENMDAYFSALVTAGFAMPRPQLAAISAFYVSWTKMRKNVATLFGMAAATQQKNFYTMTHKPNPNKKTVIPYISTEDSVVYLCMPTAGIEGNKAAIKVRVPNVKFFTAPTTLTRYFNSPSDIVAFIKRLPLIGVKLTNEKDLHKAFVKLHKEVPKGTKKTMDDFFDTK